MRFRLPDGKEVTGRSYRDIVAAMSTAKLRTPRSLKSYRRKTAQRAWSSFGVGVDPTDDRSFVLSLESANLLERIQ